jgi:hypothetical protein
MQTNLSSVRQLSSHSQYKGLASSYLLVILVLRRETQPHNRIRILEGRRGNSLRMLLLPSCHPKPIPCSPPEIRIFQRFRLSNFLVHGKCLQQTFLVNFYLTNGVGNGGDNNA